MTQEYFIALVDGTVEASIKYVREYVHAYLSDMLEDARGQIQEYGQSFNTTMVAALHTRQQGGHTCIQLFQMSALFWQLHNHSDHHKTNPGKLYTLHVHQLTKGNPLTAFKLSASSVQC